MDGWIGPYLDRRQRGEKHPVEDFLFTYYSYRPAQLRRWHPGAGVVLRGAPDLGPDYRTTAEGTSVDTDAVIGRRGESIDWIRDLLTATAGRPPNLGCFGLHEWAMVYEQSQHELRHNAWPLRLSPADTAATVRERGVRCSHFDAYRFFTPAARPLNVLTPTRAAQPDLEQPGCLHANMDLYKWAYKLVPLVGPDLVADCFALARDVGAGHESQPVRSRRARAPPPVKVETTESRGPSTSRLSAASPSGAPRCAPSSSPPSTRVRERWASPTTRYVHG